ncbi:MAG: outer membrane protein assembly factor BamD [Methylophagaceae bacterium]|jgi:outer membrane protein assembly factor BamD
MKRYIILIFVSLLALSGCSSLDINTDPLPEPAESWPVEKLYSEAKKSMDREDYETALKYYQDLEARFPFGDFAQQALIDSSYAHYKADDPENALATLDRFIRVYPQNQNMDYAIYLRGLINFTRDVGILERYLPRDESQRDPGAAKYALQDFSNLISRYPSSQYSEDASQRIVYLRNRLARYEINVAHFYMRRGSYIAALNRGKYVVENYQRTPAMPDALVIVAKAYKILEMNGLAEDTLRVLEANYPDYDPTVDIKAIVVE